MAYKKYKNRPAIIFIQGYMSFVLAVCFGLGVVKILHPSETLNEMLTTFPRWYFPIVFLCYAARMLYVSLYSFKDMENLYSESSAQAAILKVLKDRKAICIAQIEGNEVYKIGRFYQGFRYYVVIKHDEGRMWVNAPKDMIQAVDQELNTAI